MDAQKRLELRNKPDFNTHRSRIGSNVFVISRKRTRRERERKKERSTKGDQVVVFSAEMARIYSIAPLSLPLTSSCCISKAREKMNLWLPFILLQLHSRFKLEFELKLELKFKFAEFQLHLRLRLELVSASIKNTSNCLLCFPFNSLLCWEEDSKRRGNES